MIAIVLLLLVVPLSFADQLKWHHHEDFPIFKSSKIVRKDSMVWAGTTDVETQTYPDDAQLFSFQSDQPLWIHLCHMGHVTASRNNDVLACLQFDRVNLVVTLFVWKGTKSSEPTYSVVIDDINAPGEFPAIAMDNEGKYISVMGESLKGEAVLAIYTSDKTTPYHVYKSQAFDIVGTRHLAASKTGEIVAFHQDGIIANKSHTSILVFDTFKKEVKGEIIINYSTNALGLSPNGEYIAIGFLEYAVYKWDTDSSMYKVVLQKQCPPQTFLYETIVSNNGHVIQAYTSYQANQMFVYYLDPTGEVLWDYQNDPSEQLQDPPVDIEITDDFRYLVVGSWGNQTEWNKQVKVFDVSLKEKNLIWDYNTAGSIFSVDIVKNGKFLAVVAGGKSVHANVMGRGGDLYFFEIPI